MACACLSMTPIFMYGFLYMDLANPSYFNVCHDEGALQHLVLFLCL